MTREEEIRQYVKERERNIPITSSEANLIIESAKWADKTMIEKVCEWLKKNIDLYAYKSLNTHYSEIKLTECFETAFRRAMKGGVE